MTNIGTTNGPALPPPIPAAPANPVTDAAPAPAPAPVPAPAVPELAPQSAPVDANAGAENLGEKPPAAPENPAPAPEAPKPVDVKPSPAAADHAEAPKNPTPAPAGDAPKDPALPAEADAENGAKVGEQTANDGKADELNTDQFLGERRAQIEEIKTQREGAVEDKGKITDAIESLGSEVKDKEDKSGLFDRVAKSIPGAGTVMSAVDGVANLIGKDFDPVEDIANNVQNTDEARAQLTELESRKDDEIRAMDTRLETLQAELDEQVVLNFLTSTAHTTNMGEATTKFMDGQSDVDLEVASAEEMPDGDGAYNPVTGKIQLSEATMEQTQQAMESLQKQQVVDENGNITNAQAFDADHENGDTAIGTVSLIAAHELHHQQDDATGTDDVAVDLSQRIEQGTWDGTGSGPIDPKLVDAATVVAQQTGVKSAAINYALEEFQTYRQQEASDLQAGRERKVMLTTNFDGSLLPDQEAMHNLVSAFIGAPLQFGPNAGQVAPGRAYGSADSQVGDLAGTPSEADPGRTNRFGEQDPGRTNRFGEQDPGRTNRFGEQDPGRTNRFGESDPGRTNRFGESDPGRTNRFGESDPGRTNRFGESDPGRTNRF